jgi:hypothetical protein
MKEWKYHRNVHEIMQGVEQNMFQMKPDGAALLFLQANEKVSIPFVYQSTTDDTPPILTDPSQKLLLGDDALHSRVIQVRRANFQVAFRNAKKVPVAILDVVINHRHFYVDRSMRLFRCEHELVHKVIRYPLSPSLPSISKDGSPFVQNTNEKYLRCNNPDVICSQPESVMTAYIENQRKHKTDQI